MYGYVDESDYRDVVNHARQLDEACLLGIRDKDASRPPRPGSEFSSSEMYYSYLAGRRELPQPNDSADFEELPF